MTFISRITFSHLVFQECRVCAAWPMLAKISSVQFSSAWSCPALCNPIDYSMPGLPVLVEDNSRSLLRLMSIALVMPSNHLILCHLLLLLPSIFPSIRVFSSELVLHISWPKYWSFSFSISPSNEHPGLISFGMDLLTVQGTLKSLQHHSSKASIFQHSVFELNRTNVFHLDHFFQAFGLLRVRGCEHSWICHLVTVCTCLVAA